LLFAVVEMDRKSSSAIAREQSKAERRQQEPTLEFALQSALMEFVIGQKFDAKSAKLRDLLLQSLTSRIAALPKSLRPTELPSDRTLERWFLDSRRAKTKQKLEADISASRHFVQQQQGPLAFISMSKQSELAMKQKEPMLDYFERLEHRIPSKFLWQHGKSTATGRGPANKENIDQQSSGTGLRNVYRDPNTNSNARASSTLQALVGWQNQHRLASYAKGAETVNLSFTFDLCLSFGCALLASTQSN
jgi:hypothetical protein